MWAIDARVRERCWKVESTQESTPRGIVDQRIGYSESISSMHSNFANSKIPNGKRTVVLWLAVACERIVEGAKGHRSTIGDRELGIRTSSDS